MMEKYYHILFSENYFISIFKTRSMETALNPQQQLESKRIVQRLCEFVVNFSGHPSVFPIPLKRNPQLGQMFL